MSLKVPYPLIAVLGFLLSFFLLFPKNVLAVSIDISNIPAEISDQPFTVTISITGAATGTNYLRADLYKDGTHNYFGETYGKNGWYGDSDGTQYLPISIISGQTWTGGLQAKVGNPTTTEYSGLGIYKLRIRRYTSSGSAASNDQQTSQDVQISLAVSTPTPTPTPSPTPSPIATPTSNPIPTATPVKTKAPSSTTNPKYLPSSTPVLTVSPSIFTSVSPSPTSYKIASVAGASNPTITSTSPQVDIKSQKQPNLFPIVGTVLILSGLSSLTYLFIKRRNLV